MIPEAYSIRQFHVDRAPLLLPSLARQHEYGALGRPSGRDSCNEQNTIDLIAAITAIAANDLTTIAATATEIAAFGGQLQHKTTAGHEQQKRKQNKGGGGAAANKAPKTKQKTMRPQIAASLVGVTCTPKVRKHRHGQRMIRTRQSALQTASSRIRTETRPVKSNPIL